MKFFFVLIVSFSFLLAQENNLSQMKVRQPVACGTELIIKATQEKEQKIIDDFKKHANQTPLMDNGLWRNIGHKDSPFEVLEEAIKGTSWKKEDVGLINGLDISHILFRYKEDLFIVVYQNERVKIYDAFFYKNREHPEFIGLWATQKLLFGQQPPTRVLLSKTNPKLLYFLELKEDYTFNNYGIPAETYSGRYYFTKEGKIGFTNVFNPMDKNASISPSSLEFRYKKDKSGFVLEQ